MEKKMETTIMSHIGTTTRIRSLIPMELKVRQTVVTNSPFLHADASAHMRFMQCN